MAEMRRVELRGPTATNLLGMLAELERRGAETFAMMIANAELSRPVGLLLAQAASARADTFEEMARERTIARFDAGLAAPASPAPHPTAMDGPLACVFCQEPIPAVFLPDGCVAHPRCADAASPGERTIHAAESLGPEEIELRLIDAIEQRDEQVATPGRAAMSPRSFARCLIEMVGVAR